MVTMHSRDMHEGTDHAAVLRRGNLLSPRAHLPAVALENLGYLRRRCHSIRRNDALALEGMLLDLLVDSCTEQRRRSQAGLLGTKLPRRS